jgi:hypothetical protein
VTRIVVFAVLALVGIVILAGIGWIAALVYAFLVDTTGVTVRLLTFAEDRAEEHGGWRFDKHDH